MCDYGHIFFYHFPTKERNEGHKVLWMSRLKSFNGGNYDCIVYFLRTFCDVSDCSDIVLLYSKAADGCNYRTAWQI